MFRFKGVGALSLVVWLSILGSVGINTPVNPAEGLQSGYRIWPSKAPAGCPFPSSKDITGVAFSGRHREYADADTWYPSWASDGNLYSPFTDGVVNGTRSMSVGQHATTGQAKIVGSDPMALTVFSLGVCEASSLPYVGRYPSANLLYNGIWYYGTYALDDAYLETLNCNACTIGPFVGFRVSYDFGKTWTDTKLTPDEPLFKESAKGGKKVRMGAPHFVDFGKNMEHSPDGKAYLVAHGAIDPDASESWIAGDQIYMARVIPTPEHINDASKWEFFAGFAGGRGPRWSRVFSEIRPIVQWKGHCGVVTMTYDAGLKKYLMCVADPNGLGGAARSPEHPQAHGVPYSTYLLESEEITGPWSLITYMEKFGEQAYFVNIPSKFVSSDGRTAWLCYSNNWTTDQIANPPGGRYGLCLQEVKFLFGDAKGIPATEPSPNQWTRSRATVSTHIGLNYH